MHRDKAMEWLFAPVLALATARAVDLSILPGGRHEILDLLIRIKYGAYW